MKSLTDVVSGSGLSAYAEIALILFVIAFLAVVVSLFLPSRQKTYEHLRQLPMGEDTDPTPIGGHDRDSSTPALRASARNDMFLDSVRTDRHA